MRLASMKDQSDYNKLSKLLSDLDFDWKNAAVAAYRSEIDNTMWADETDKVNYRINWRSGEPNNYDGIEDCIGEMNYFNYSLNKKIKVEIFSFCIH